MTTKHKLHSIFKASVEEADMDSATIVTASPVTDVPVAAAVADTTTVATATVPALDPSVDAEFKAVNATAGSATLPTAEAPVESPAVAAAEPLGTGGQAQAEVVDGAEVIKSEASAAASTESSTLETTPIAPVVADPTELTEATPAATKEIGEGVVDLIVEKTEAATAIALENDESATAAVLVVLDSAEVKQAIATLPEDASAVVVELPADVVEQIEELPSGVDMDVVEQATQLATENENAIDEAAADHERSETLATYAEALEAMVVSNVTSSHDVAMFKLSVEAFASTVEMEGKVLMPSIEGMVAEKPESLKLSLEDIHSLCASVESGIFDAARKVISGVGKLFQFIFKSYDSILVKVKQLRVSIKTSKTLESRKITVSNLHRLHVGGKVDAVTIIKGLDATAKVAGEIYGPYYKQIQVLYKDLGVALVNTKKSFKKNLHDVEDAMSDYGNKITTDFGRLTKLAENNPEFSGGKVFALTTGLRVIPVVQSADKSPSVTSKQEVQSLTAEQALKVLTSVETIISIVRERMQSIIAGDTGTDSIIKGWQADAKANPGFFKFFSRALKAYSAHRIISPALSGALYQPINAVSYSAFGSVNAAVAYVSKSVK